VRTVAVDLGQRVAEVVGQWVGGGEGLASGFDLHGAVAAGGADEFLDAPVGLVLDVVADGPCGKHDSQVDIDRFAGVVVDGLCRCLDYADDRVIGAGQRSGTADGVGIAFGSGFFFS
jgi:hypothetical protein